MTAAFQGMTVSIGILYASIARRGWEVTKVKYGTDGWEAEAKHPEDGQQVKATAPTEDAAVAHLLMRITRLDYIRSRARMGSWQTAFVDKLAEIADAYAKAPIYQPKAVGAWMELAEDCKRRYEVLQGDMHIEVTDDPDPYDSAQDMAEDVQKHKHLFVSRANADHPVWSVDQVVHFRAVHNVLGHVAAGADFGWHGENAACAAHFPLISPTAQQALFTEALARNAYHTVYQGYGPTKIALLEDHIVEAMDKENGAGHMGVHPSQSLVPTEVPQTPHTASDIQEVTPPGFEPRRDGLPWKGLKMTDGRVYTWKIDAPSGPGARPHHKHGVEAIGLDPTRRNYENGVEELLGSVQNSYGHGQNVLDILDRKSHTNTGYIDPNDGWESGIEPLLGVNGQPIRSIENDPLGIHRADDEGVTAMDQAANLARIDPTEPDKRWWDLAHPDGSPNRMAMRKAVVNALTASILAPQRDAQWHAVHYQDLADHAHTTEDPEDLHRRLEQRRLEWNRGRRISPLAHKPYYREQQDFAKFIKSSRPGLNDAQAHALAAATTQRILDGEMTRLSDELATAEGGKPPEKRTTLSQIEAEAGRETARILKDLMNPGHDPATDVSRLAQAEPADGGTIEQFDGEIPPEAMGAYGAWRGDHLRSIAQASRHGDGLLDAALADVRRHDATGHHFRSYLLSLGLRGVGPQAASHAWYMLAPERSQLATIDGHMLEALGRKREENPAPRDYFKLERELRARMDAAGYHGVPLGVLQQALGDYKLRGRDSHQDLTPLRPLHHVDHDQVDWLARKPKGKPSKLADPWWKETEPAGKQVGQHFDDMIGSRFPADHIPFQDDRRYMPVTAATKTGDELHVAWPVPPKVRKQIANWVATVEWPEGVELEDPAEYHITAVYAHGGWNDRTTHTLIKQHTSTDVRFESTGLELFGPDKDTVVIRLSSERADELANKLMDDAESLGLDVSRFPGGYKPHITVACGASSLPEGDAPGLTFRAGKLYVSRPRELVESEPDEHHIFAALGDRAPVITHPDGDSDVGAPGETIMQYLRGQLGLTTEQAWEFAGSVAKTGP